MVDERTKFGKPSHRYGITVRGKCQAEITRDYLKERFGAFDLHYLSYYERARQTMKILVPDAKARVDERMRETERGIWHSLTREEIEKSFPFEIERKKREGLYHYRPWGGENWPDVQLRIRSFLETVNRDQGGKRVLFVVHGHWLILLEMLLQHFSIEEAERRYRDEVVENCSVTVYVSESGSRLRLVDHNIVPWRGKL
jgi:broad specificity phosphatase PhoE